MDIAVVTVQWGVWIFPETINRIGSYGIHSHGLSRMELEGKLIEVLSTVKNVKRAGKNKIALYASDKEPVMLLSKRFSVVPLSELEGEWDIVKVYGDTLSTDLEVRPGVKFDIADGRISWKLGL